MPVLNNETEEYKSEMQEIITAPLPWLIRWGMFLIFLFLLMIIGLSALIRYPEVIRLPLRVSSVNINPGTRQFYGLMAIPQSTISKVKVGQEIFIRLKSFPSGEFGILRGRISTLPHIPLKDSVFMSIISFDLKSPGLSKAVHLKDNLTADAEIVLQNTSLFCRVLNGLIKTVN